MKIQRALLIMFFLMKRGLASTKEIAEYLEISKRTVYRDIEELKTAGVDIVSVPGKGGGYRVSEDFKLDKLLFNDNELNTILFSSNMLSQFSNTEFAGFAEDLTKKLTGLKAQKGESSNVSQEKVLIDCQYVFRDEEYNNRLSLVEKAVNNDEIVFIEYQSPLCQSMSTSNYVNPYGIINKVGFWYMVGFCHEHQAFRVLNVTFIKKILLTGKKFKRDPKFNLADFWNKQTIIKNSKKTH